MKVAVISLVILGIVAAGCAAVLIAAVTSRSAPSASGGNVGNEPMVDVLVASRELVPNTIVDTTAVTMRKVPKSQVPPNALLNSVQVVGKVITDHMLEK